MQFWPGQIDMTRDLLPVIARPPGQEHVRFILGCVGIPWATFCGSFAARNVLGEADEDYRKYFNYFSNQRHFALPSSLGKVIGKPLLFSLANSWAKFYQVDTLRAHRGDGEGVLIPAATIVRWCRRPRGLTALCQVKSTIAWPIAARTAFRR